jgi:hypothetical protein
MPQSSPARTDDVSAAPRAIVPLPTRFGKRQQESPAAQVNRVDTVRVVDPAGRPDFRSPGAARHRRALMVSVVLLANGRRRVGEGVGGDPAVRRKTAQPSGFGYLG